MTINDKDKITIRRATSDYERALEEIHQRPNKKDKCITMKFRTAEYY